MRGIILAGGLGTRLMPLTTVTNKHLLPVYNKPMICHPIRSLVTAGVTDILLITGGNYAGEFMKLLGNGEDFKCNLRYAYQKGNGGIADALKLGEDFSRHEPFITILGDNYYEENLSSYVQNFINQGHGARVLLKEALPEQLDQFGIAEIKEDRVINIVEKPTDPSGKHIVTGAYMFDYKVWWFLDRLRPSARGEYEVTDLLNMYIESIGVKYDILKDHWGDMGTHDSLLATANYIAKRTRRNKK